MGMCGLYDELVELVRVLSVVLGQEGHGGVTVLSGEGGGR
jgi:hypothetical protein